MHQQRASGHQHCEDPDYFHNIIEFKVYFDETRGDCGKTSKVRCFVSVCLHIRLISKRASERMLIYIYQLKLRRDREGY